MLSKNDIVIPIGFFLHIPFPKPDHFKKLSHFEEILEGMLGRNMIGFHTKEYCLNFLECCQTLPHCKVLQDDQVDSMKVTYHGRVVLVRAIPAGISDSVSAYSTGDFSKECPVNLRSLCMKWKDKQMIIGVDRMDYTKGLIEKFKAFQALLYKYPNLDGQIVIVQIAPLCRSENPSYKRLQNNLLEEVDRINNELREKGFTSTIELIPERVSRKDLAVLYKQARVGFVTPLIDGLNLVAMEYVASQSSLSPGVLVVSKFAGVAKTLHGALMVNPYDKEAMVKALHDALRMEVDERRQRMSNLKKTVKHQSSERFIEENISIHSASTLQ